MHLYRIWHVSMVTVLLGACGAQPQVLSRDRVSAVAPLPVVAPVPVAPDQRSYGELQRVLAGVTASAQSFETLYSLDERVDGVSRKTLYEMRFRKTPRVSCMEVLESSHLPRGFRIRDTGAGTVSVRLPGVLRFINVSVPARSEQAKTLMGVYPTDITPERFTVAASQPDARVREVEPLAQDGRRLRMFEVDSSKSPVAGARLTLGVGASPDYVYHLVLRRPDGATLTQRFSRLTLRRFSDSELAL